MHKILIFPIVFSSLLLTGCNGSVLGGEQSYVSSPPWKETDKHLNCDQLLLEMNDAKFWQTIAADNKRAGVMDVIWPVGYINQRASADEALAATSARLSHLGNIYSIKGCNQPYPNMQMPRPSIQ